MFRERSGQPGCCLESSGSPRSERQCWAGASCASNQLWVRITFSTKAGSECLARVQ
jgi:hypothetical protein